MAAPVDIGTLIVSTPGTLGGRPRIAGTRIGVETVAILWKQGYTAEDIVNGVFTDLRLDQVHAALSYYFANRDAVDRRVMEDDLAGVTGNIDALSEGSGPPWLSAEERAIRIHELELEAALLRSRLGLK